MSAEVLKKYIDDTGEYGLNADHFYFIFILCLSVCDLNQNTDNMAEVKDRTIPRINSLLRRWSDCTGGRAFLCVLLFAPGETMSFQINSNRSASFFCMFKLFFSGIIAVRIRFIQQKYQNLFLEGCVCIDTWY